MKKFIMRLRKDISEHHVMLFAKSMALSIFLALFPTLVLIVSLLGVFGAEDLVVRTIDSLNMPREITDIFQDQFLAIAQSNVEAQLTIAAGISLVLALWGLAGFMRTLIEALNVMYADSERRRSIHLYGLSLALSFGLVVSLVSSMFVLVFSSDTASYIGDKIGLGHWAVQIIQWPLIFALTVGMIQVIYTLCPSHKIRWRFWSFGSIFAATGWFGFSYLFGLYLQNFANYNATYGVLAGFVVFLLYCVYSSAIVLIGAEINRLKHQ